jgi:hypothetical protein
MSRARSSSRLLIDLVYIKTWTATHTSAWNIAIRKRITAPITPNSRKNKAISSKTVICFSGTMFGPISFILSRTHINQVAFALRFFRARRYRSRPYSDGVDLGARSGYGSS